MWCDRLPLTLFHLDDPKKKVKGPFLHELFAFQKPYEVRVMVMFLHHTGGSLAAATVVK